MEHAPSAPRFVSTTSRMQGSKDGSHANIVLECQSRHALAVGMPFGDLAPLTGIQGRRSTKLLALRLGALDAFLASLADQLALELRHRPHDREDQLAVRRRRVEPAVLERLEHDAAGPQLVNDAQ